MPRINQTKARQEYNFTRKELKSIPFEKVGRQNLYLISDLEAKKQEIEKNSPKVLFTQKPTTQVEPKKAPSLDLFFNVFSITESGLARKGKRLANSTRLKECRVIFFFFCSEKNFNFYLLPSKS